MGETQGRAASLPRDIGFGFSALAVLLAMFFSAAYRRFGGPSTPPPAVMHAVDKAVEKKARQQIASEKKVAPRDESPIFVARVPVEERGSPPAPPAPIPLPASDVLPPVVEFAPGTDVALPPAIETPPIETPSTNRGNFSIEAESPPTSRTNDFNPTSQALPRESQILRDSGDETSRHDPRAFVAVPAEPTAMVQSGDSHWTIAQRVYGDGNYFRALYKHNRHEFPHPDDLPTGRLVKVPPVEHLRQQYPDMCPRAKSSVSQVSYSSGRHALPSSAHRSYSVQSGESLFDIARFELGQASRYVEIIRLNPERLPANQTGLLPTGLQLRLPVK